MLADTGTSFISLKSTYICLIFQLENVKKNSKNATYGLNETAYGLTTKIREYLAITKNFLRSIQNSKRYFIGQHFRHQAEISTILSDKTENVENRQFLFTPAKNRSIDSFLEAAKIVLEVRQENFGSTFQKLYA